MPRVNLCRDPVKDRQEATRRIIRRGMAEQGFDRQADIREKGLAEYLGCSEKSVRRILDEEPVKMIQEQYIRLLLLGRKL